MEEVTEELIELSGFAPLIQIWAGICLLFFYETLLKKFPLEKTKEQTKALFDEFTANYQVYIEPEKMPQFESFQGTKWEANFLPTIRNMAALSSFFSVFVHVYYTVIPAGSQAESTEASIHFFRVFPGQFPH